MSQELRLLFFNRGVHARRLVRVGVAAACVAAFTPGALIGQSGAPRETASTALLRAVLMFRFAAVESSLPVNACRIVRLMETPTDFPNAYPVAIQNVFDRRDDPCVSAPEPARPDSGRLLAQLPKDPGGVWIDSVRRVDSVAVVYMTVKRHGDAVHTEAFKATYRPALKDWYVSEVRVFGLWYPR